MVTHSFQKKRGVMNRRQKSLILFGLEGKNKTEKNYFSNFQQIRGKFIIRWASGNATDPVGIVENIKRYILKKNLKEGDRAFAVFDMDIDPLKEAAVEKARNLAKGQNIELITSNPCFEVWFVLHFEDSTASYNSSKDVINKLRTYITSYKKSDDVFEVLQGRMKDAILRAKKLRAYHKDNKTCKLSEQNPVTGVDQVVELLCDSEEVVTSLV